MDSRDQMPDLSMDPKALCREDIYTDRRAGTIRCLTPVNGDGSTDSTRPVTYVGQAQLMTPVGTLPLSFEIDAASLEEAARKFGDAANVAVEQAVEELKELRREQASSIVVPEMGGPGGVPGGGKIQLR
ncbi:MAG: hypothetical protein WCC36_02345 [Gammaproteobacteria bacterium]